MVTLLSKAAPDFGHLPVPSFASSSKATFEFQLKADINRFRYRASWQHSGSFSGLTASSSRQ
jgi:hypothetical protein